MFQTSDLNETVMSDGPI